MITEGIFNCFFVLIEWLIDLLPTQISLPDWLETGINLINSIISFFPVSILNFAFYNISFWLVLHFVWSIVEWIYKKIPGVD